MMNVQREEDERQERNEYGADWPIKEVTYLRSILHNEDQLINKDEPQKVPCPKVPPLLRKKKRSKEYYDPKIVSFGPYHHGRAELRAAETIKTKVAREFISENGKSIEDLYIKVHKLNEYARRCYIDGSTGDYSEEAFALMMLLDGCFIIVLIEHFVSRKQKGNEFSMIRSHLGILSLQYLIPDMLLLENQIPFRVLEVLMRNIYNNEKEGLTMIKSFLNIVHWGKFQNGATGDEDMQPRVHLLELLKTQISKHHPEKGKRATDIDITRYLQSFGSVCDLQAKGIKFKPCNTISLHSGKNKKTRSISLRDVEFRLGFFTGELKLPPLILGSDSQVYYTNLIAFEMCATGTHHNDFTVSSYISFMNSIIDYPEDVKELRSKRIILHTLSSDEEVFRTLKEISTTNWPQDFFIYQEVREVIEKHYNSKIRTWMAVISHKYFSYPWSAFGLLVAGIAIVLSFLQTIYTIYPPKS